MAAGDGRYITLAEFKLWVRSEQPLENELYGDALAAAETTLDNALARRVAVAGASSERVFVPSSGSDVLWIDDCTTVTTVTENGTALTVNVDYQLEPLNGLSAAGEARPYDLIRRLDACWYSDGPKATVTVDATWGWSAIPAPIKQSCLIVGKDALEQRDVRHGIVAVTDSGAFGPRDAKFVADTIREYRGHRSWGIA
jgi:hypothetical protein